MLNQELASNQNNPTTGLFCDGNWPRGSWERKNVSISPLRCHFHNWKISNQLNKGLIWAMASELVPHIFCYSLAPFPAFKTLFINFSATFFLWEFDEDTLPRQMHNRKYCMKFKDSWRAAWNMDSVRFSSFRAGPSTFTGNKGSCILFGILSSLLISFKLHE